MASPCACAQILDQKSWRERCLGSYSVIRGRKKLPETGNHRGNVLEHRTTQNQEIRRRSKHL